LRDKLHVFIQAQAKNEGTTNCSSEKKRRDVRKVMAVGPEIPWGKDLSYASTLGRKRGSEMGKPFDGPWGQQ